MNDEVIRINRNVDVIIPFKLIDGESIEMAKLRLKNNRKKEIRRIRQSRARRIGNMVANFFM